MSEQDITRAMVRRATKQLITDVTHREWALRYWPPPKHKSWEGIARSVLEAALREGRP